MRRTGGSLNGEQFSSSRFAIGRTVQMTAESHVSPSRRWLRCDQQADEGYLFGRVEKSIPECQQRGLGTSQGCKEAVIENNSLNVMKKKDKNEVNELNNFFHRALDKVNYTFPEKLLEIYGFPQ